MITLEQFKSYMQKLDEIEKKEENLDNALKDISPDFGGISFIEITDVVYEILKDVFKDKFDWIGYWRWELEKGTKWKKGTITEKNGKEIKLKTVEDLYNLLIKEMNTK